MVDPLSGDDAEDRPATKGDFVGRIVYTAIEVDDPEFQSNFESDAVQIDLLYEIELLSHDWKNQTERWVTVSNNIRSKWMTFIWHLQKVFDIPDVLFEDGVISQKEYEEAATNDDTETIVSALLEFLNGKVLKFTDLSWEEDFEMEFPAGTITPAEIAEQTNVKGTFMVPKDVLDEDELVDLGVEDVGDAEVTETDL